MADLALVHEEEWANAEAKFNPLQAEEIIRAFEDKTGRSLVIPAAIPKEQKVKVLEENLVRLYGQHTQMISLQGWIDLFETRLATGPSGLSAEIDADQVRIGKMSAQGSGFRRSIEFLPCLTLKPPNRNQTI